MRSYKDACIGVCVCSRPAAASIVLGKHNLVHPSEQLEDHQAELMKDDERATHLGNGDSLLFHGFVDCHTVIFPHLHWKDTSIRILTQERKVAGE